MTKGLPRSLSRGKTSAQIVTKLKIPLNGLSVTVTSVAAAIGFGSVIIGGLPEAHLKIMAVAVNIQLSGSGADANLADTWLGDFGIGTTPASDATISGDDVNLIEATPMPAATAEVGPLFIVANGVDLILDNTDGSLEVNLNVLIDAADIVDDESVILTLTGVVEITLITMLDD